MKPFSPFAALLLAATLSACSTPQRTEQPSQYMPWGALRPDSSQAVTFNDSAPPPNVVVADHTRDGQIVILSLSGGGAFGAFGAGVLAGWTQSGTRPEADVVTGVSAGALLATYAFLGPEYDQRAENIYANITNANVYEKRDILSVPFAPSFASQKPLKSLMEGVITDDILEKVARERRERGRRLLVASTDLDNGRVVVWDLTAIATSTRPDRRAFYIDALMASSAIPGFFEPIMISPEPDAPDKRMQMHVDGSMSTSIFMPAFIDTELRQPLKVYAIVNSQLLEERSEKLLKVNSVEILEAAVMKMMRTVLQRSVYDVYVTTMFSGGEFYLIGMPEDAELRTSQLSFKPEVSTKLTELGKSMARQGKWMREPPRFDSLTTQAQMDKILARLRPLPAGAPAQRSRSRR